MKKELENIKNLNVNWNYVIIGLVTRQGFSNRELIKLLNVNHATISNWLNFHTTLYPENRIKVYNLISRLNLDVFSLEKIGKIDWKTIINYIKDELKIGDHLIAASLGLIPSLINSYSKVRIPERKNRKLLLNLYQKIKNTKDKRKIIREIYEKSFLNNEYGILLRSIRNYLDLNLDEFSKSVNLSNDVVNAYERGRYKLSKNVFSRLYQKLLKFEISKKEIFRLVSEEKNKWLESKNYPEIINFIQQKSNGTNFELEIYNKLKSIGYFKKIFLWPILSNENLSINFKADIYAIGNDNKHYLIDAKQFSNYSVATKIKSCALIKNKIKEIDELVIVTKKNHPLTNKHFGEIGIWVISINRLEELDNIFENDVIKDNKNSLRNIRKKLALSQYQFAILLKVNVKSIRNWEALRYKCKLNISKRLNNIFDISRNKSLSYLQFKANKLLIMKNVENIKLRLLRLELNITQRGLAKRIGISRRTLQEFETGKYKSKFFREKVLCALKEVCDSESDFTKMMKKIEIDYSKYLASWKLAEKFIGIINLVNINLPYKNKGFNFEKQVEKCFNLGGYKTIHNVIISDDNGRWYTEVDILAINSSNKISLISCVENNSNSYLKLNELKFIGDMFDVKNLIFVCKNKINDKTIDKWKKLGVKIKSDFKASFGSYKYA